MLNRSGFRNLVTHVRNGEMEPELADTHELSELWDAQRRFRDGEYVGKPAETP